MSTLTQEEYQHHVSSVWRVTFILGIVTVVEVVAAVLYPESMPRMMLNLFFIVMSLIKAFYIVAVFMHMKYERRAMQLTVLLPTLFLAWA